MMKVMDKEWAKRIIGDGSVWEVDGKEYYVGYDEEYTNKGYYSYFDALELGVEMDDDEDIMWKYGVYIVFPKIEEDSEYYNPEPEEWDAEYDEHRPEVWTKQDLHYHVDV